MRGLGAGLIACVLACTSTGTFLASSNRVQAAVIFSQDRALSSSSSSSSSFVSAGSNGVGNGVGSAVAASERGKEREERRGKTVKLPLKRGRRTARSREQTFEAMERHQRRYYATDAGLEGMGGRAVNITDENIDNYYLATIAVGNPAQDLSVILDTGSSWLGIANSSCSPSSGCPAGTRLYNSSASRTYIPGTFVNEKTLQYGIGSTSGLVCREQVSFAGFTVANVTFLQAGSFSPSFGLTKRQSGIMGLGLPPLAVAVGPPGLDALTNTSVSGASVLQSAPVDAQLFSLVLYRNNEAALSSGQEDPLTDGGIFTIGTLDTSQFEGNVTWLDVPAASGGTYGGKKAFWIVYMDALSLGGTNVLPANETERTAVVDSGTAFISGPAYEVSRFYALIPGSASLGSSAGGTRYSIPCKDGIVTDTSLNMSITLGGVAFPISYKDLIVAPVDADSDADRDATTQCIGALIGSQTAAGSSNPRWILGDVFMKNVFTAFRYAPGPSIGFATLSPSLSSSNTSSSSDTTPSDSTSSAARSNPIFRLQSHLEKSKDGHGQPTPTPTPTPWAILLGALEFGLAAMLSAF